MQSLLVDSIVILVLVLLNGFFSCAEFAIVSLRKSRVSQLAEEGDPRASIVMELQRDPHRVLAVVQIGVTLVGSCASAFGGIVAVEVVKPILSMSGVSVIHDVAEPVAVMLVVLVISYMTLVLGELVPKAIGLERAEWVALRVAGVIRFLSRVSGVAVSFLTLSSSAVLSIFRIRGGNEAFMTREEVRQIVAEGQETGHFTETEHEYIKNLFDFTHTHVREVMTPRTRMTMLDASSPPEELLKVILENEYSRYPIYRDEPENIIGFVHGKDFLGGIIRGDFALERIIRPTFFVPEGKRVNELLEEMQRKRIHMAIVVDEYGGVSGLVTTEDLIEELVGEIEDEHDVGEPKKVEFLPDGTIVVDPILSVSDLSDILDVRIDDDAEYDTVAGLILSLLGRFPEKGEEVAWGEFRFVCLEVTAREIVRVSISRREMEDAPSVSRT